MQKHRLIAISSPLGEDVLLFRRMKATEQLGRLFELELELLSTDDQIKLPDLLGQNMTLRLQLFPDGTRYFNGFVSRFSIAGSVGRYALYRASLRPWLWFLTRTADCRIFQEQSVPDIIKAIFREHGFTDFKELLSGSYSPREYCVQYRETDFDFVSRLMEEEGIYYYFEHQNGKHILVLADSYSSHSTYPGYEEVPYYPPEQTMRRERDHLYDWEITQQVMPGAYALNDFDFKVPKKSLRCQASIPRSHALSDFEIYDGFGMYVERGKGDQYSRVRIEEQQAQHELAQAQGDARGMCAGYLFNLINYPRADQNREYLIVGTVYELISNEYESGDQGSPGTSCACECTLMDAKQPFRSTRITSKPVVQGPQTAIVVGPSGEEIFTDEYGRVKCQFHWDRYGQGNEKSSCWVRVAQSWAGKKWGAMYIPRIGHEVIVEFLEGDPDQPIVIGRVYNGDNMPPYPLPAEKTKSTLKSSSSKGGGGFNEIRYEDKKGKEQIFVHAERNQDVRVKNDAFEWIGNERHLVIKANQYEQVEGDKHLILKASQAGKGDQYEELAGDRHLKIKGDSNEKVDGTLSVEAGMDRQEKVGMKHALDAGMEIHLKAGMNVVIEAGLSITLKAGGGFIVVGPAGVMISGTPVLINSGGSAGSGSGASPEAPTAPKAAKEADTAQPGEIAEVSAQPIQPKARKLPSTPVQAMQAQALKDAAQIGAPFCEKCQAASAGS